MGVERLGMCNISPADKQARGILNLSLGRGVPPGP